MAATQRVATPDGQPLSGWWRRVGATLLDSVLTSAVGMALAWPWLSEIGRAYGDLIRLISESARTGGPLPDTDAFTARIADPMQVVVLILWGVQLVYGVGFLKAFAATPGKMLLGLEVRLRERPGPLPWGTVLLRWFTQNAGILLRVVPVIPVFFSLYALLDVLWPLWDGKRQALHDKAARTNVVRRTA